MDSHFSIDSIFPLPIFFNNNSELVNECILKICLQMCSGENLANNNYGDCNFSKNVYVLEEPIFVEIKKFILENLNFFFENVYNIEQKIYITNSFISIKNKNQKHIPHAHTNSFISGTFYINTPPKSKLNFFQQPQIFSGFKNINFDVLNQNRFNTNAISYNVKRGDLFIFPSFLAHGVEENTYNEPRVCISFNTFVKGTFGRHVYSSDLFFK